MKEDFILKLVEKFDKSSSVFLHIKDKDTDFVLKKAEAIEQPVSALVQPVNYAGTAGSSIPQLSAEAVPQQSAGVPKPAAPTALAAEPQSGKADTGVIQIKSPIVGTFYRSPSPDAPPYVEKGTKVKKGQPLCILEAMKMMNTLEAEVDGIIEDILVSNGDLVEFEQSIFTIRVE